MKDKDKEKKYTRDELLKSKRFSYVQPGFLKALLTKKEYTIKEADQVIRKFYGGEC